MDLTVSLSPSPPPTYTDLIFTSRFGPDSFEDAAAPLANKNKPAGLDWNRLKYMVFDIPNHPGTYAERYGRLGTPITQQSDTRTNPTTNPRSPLQNS